MLHLVKEISQRNYNLITNSGEQLHDIDHSHIIGISTLRTTENGDKLSLGLDYNHWSRLNRLKINNKILENFITGFNGKCSWNCRQWRDCNLRIGREKDSEKKFDWVVLNFVARGMERLLVVGEWADQVGVVEDPPCIKIRYGPWNPSWIFSLCFKIGYSSAQSYEIVYGFGNVLREGIVRLNILR